MSSSGSTFLESIEARTLRVTTSSVSAGCVMLIRAETTSGADAPEEEDDEDEEDEEDEEDGAAAAAAASLIVCAQSWRSRASANSRSVLASCCSRRRR